MLTNLSARKPGDSSPRSSLPEMLHDCHLRIRHFLQLSRTLANADGAPMEEISHAAGAIRRYFLQALPLHEADEEQTLLPRLEAAIPAGDPVREAAHLMVEQHRAAEELVPELLSLCEAIEQKPARLPVLAHRLRRVNQAYAQVLEAHLELEESVIFPALRNFPAALLEEMTRETLERRRASAPAPADAGPAPEEPAP